MWTAVIIYRTIDGKMFIPLRVQALSEVDAIIKKGPDILSIDKIEIIYNAYDHSHMCDESDFTDLNWDYKP